MDDVMRLANEAVARCRLLAGFSESSTGLTRTFLSPPFRDCHRVISSWMVALGMRVATDAIGNLRGIRKSDESRRLIIGSHIDTVPQAGSFDGVLGVVIGLALVEALAGERLPFEIEVIAFSEEEGIRFRTPFLGSRALAGTLRQEDLAISDAAGITVHQAILDYGLDAERISHAQLDANRTIGFVEFHIEQGPVLADANLPLAVVQAIAGQSRFGVRFRGAANHAGTTPMHRRHDALAAAAEWIVAVENEALETAGLVATVGSVAVSPNASNVIAGDVLLSLDVRHQSDGARLQAVKNMMTASEEIAGRRMLSVEWEHRLDQPAVHMSADLVELARNHVPLTMVSGAGHDAMILAPIIPTVMLFVRSPGGISHHPDETVRVDDVAGAIGAGLAILRNLAERYK